MIPAKPSFERPHVASEPIDPLLREKLSKLERILINDYQMDSAQVIRILNYVYANFVENSGSTKRAPVRDRSGKSDSNESINNQPVTTTNGRY